jgi:hypothetical protein
VASAVVPWPLHRVTVFQSEISRAYVAEMENELEKNPRGAAQAVNILSTRSKTNAYLI